MHENLINNCDINFEKIIKNRNIKLENLLSMRVPPFFWDLMGYLFGLFVLFYNNYNSIILGGIFFTSYGVLNIIFDTFTFSYEYTNDLLPKYNELKFYNWTIVNKKYNLKDGEEKNENKNITLDDHYINKKNVDVSNLKLELSFYIGNNEKIELLLNYIYLFGITKKNYTQINRDKLKDKSHIFI